MDDVFDLDDAAADDLIAGRAGAAHARLDALLRSMQRTYVTGAPPVGDQLSVFLSAGAAPVAPPRVARVRAAFAAKVAAATAVVAAATGGLAVAGALPGPVQSAVSGAASHVGLDLPEPAGSHAANSPVFAPASTVPPVTDAPGTTTTIGSAPTTVPGRGHDVATVARGDDPSGCEHGAAVSGIASDGKSHSSDASCAQRGTPPTTAGPSGDGTPPEHGGGNHPQDPGAHDGTGGGDPASGGDHGGGDGHGGSGSGSDHVGSGGTGSSGRGGSGD